MISEKVLGVYAAVGALPPAQQAVWYERVGAEMGISAFEIPILAGVPLPEELVDAFGGLPASLVVTLVAQGASVGRENPSYGLASLDEGSRHAAVMDACAILQQCYSFSQQGIRIRDFMVQTGQRMGESIEHAIAFYRSLISIREVAAAVLPDTALVVEPADCLPADHLIPFPAAKKSPLTVTDLIQTLAAVNRDVAHQRPIEIVLNWGRMLVDGCDPLEQVEEILDSEVPLEGVILSGAGASLDGFRDSHNSHLDPDSGFNEADAVACADVLAASPQPIFLGMKCSRLRGETELSAGEVLKAQAHLLHQFN